MKSWEQPSGDVCPMAQHTVKKRRFSTGSLYTTYSNEMMNVGSSRGLSMPQHSEWRCREIFQPALDIRLIQGRNGGYLRYHHWPKLTWRLWFSCLTAVGRRYETNPGAAKAGAHMQQEYSHTGSILRWECIYAPRREFSSTLQVHLQLQKITFTLLTYSLEWSKWFTL